MATGGGQSPQQVNYMTCEKHPDKKVEIFCEQHAVVCCLSCAWKDHHECRPKPCMLEDARKKFQENQVSLIDQLISCSDVCDEREDALSKLIGSLENAETSVRTKFTQIKSEVYAKLDELEEQLSDDISKFLGEKVEQLKDILTDLKQQKRDIAETKQTVQNLIKTDDPLKVAAFVKIKRLVTSFEPEVGTDIKIPIFNVSKEIHSFLNCSSVGKFTSGGDDYENVSIGTSRDNGAKPIKDDETLMMSDILPETKDIKPPKQERTGITFGKIFRLFKFRGTTENTTKKTTPTANLNPLPLAASGNIEDEEWYHGNITREVANARLLDNGDYLLRAKPNDTGSSDYVLSVCSKIQHHAFIKSEKGGWKFKGKRFSTIEDLVKHLHHTMTPLINASHKVVLQCPISSKPLADDAQATAESVKRVKSCIDDEDGYADLFEAGDTIVRKAAVEQVIEEVIANYDFPAKEQDELAFQKGEHLKILSKEGDWWKARNNKGQTGMIPGNYVTKEVGEQAEQTQELYGEPEEEDDSNFSYEVWGPPPSAAPEYEYCCDISEIPWFHGCLPRENAEKRLNSDGDFLVREHRGNDDKFYVLSVFWNGSRHFKYKKTLFDQPHNPVQYYIGTEVPIKQTSDVRLRNPVLRESWELRNDDIEIQEKIGTGHYGTTHKGMMKRPKAESRQVTLYMAGKDMPEDKKKLFLGAAQILHEMNHQNILKCVGIAMDYEPVIVVMECMKGDTLLSYLRETSSVSLARQVEVCIDVAEALVYLQERKCIHRDVAARNCLIGDGGIVKLSEFENASKLDALRPSSQNFKFPIKWTAPEVIRGCDISSYCQESDVWGFGVLVWEVFSKGKVPYPGTTNRDAADKVLDGYRMPAPEGAPEFIAKLMSRCWQDDPNRRPNIKHITHWFKSAQKRSDPEKYVLPPQPPPVSARPLSSLRGYADRKVPPLPKPKIPVTNETLKEQMKHRPLPPLPSTEEDSSKTNTEDDETETGPPPPPRPLHLRVPPKLPAQLKTEEEDPDEDFLEST